MSFHLRLRPVALSALAAALAGGAVLHAQARSAWSDLQAEAASARSRLGAQPTIQEPLFSTGVDGSAFQAYEGAVDALLGEDRGTAEDSIREIIRATSWSDDPAALTTRRALVAQPASQDALRLLRVGARSRDKRPSLDWTSHEELPRLSHAYALVRLAVAQASLLALDGRDGEAVTWHLDAAQLGVDLLGGHTAVTSAIGFSAINWALHDDDGPARSYADYGPGARRQLMEAAQELDARLTFDPLQFDGEMALTTAFLQRVEQEKGFGAGGWRSAIDLPDALAPTKAMVSVREALTDEYLTSDARGHAAFRDLVLSHEPGDPAARVLAPLYSVESSRLYTRSRMRALAVALSVSLDGSDDTLDAPVDALGTKLIVDDTASTISVRSQEDAYQAFTVFVTRRR